MLEPADIWCAPVQDYRALMQHEGFQALAMTQRVETARGHALTTTRCPIRIDGQVLRASRAAPALGQHTAQIEAEHDLRGAQPITTETTQ